MPDHYYVYPAYLAKETSRADGRRVPASRAPATASLEQILAAAKVLGLQAQAEPEREYPRQGGGELGRVKVTKKSGLTKARLLRMLADEIRKAGPAPAR